MIEKWVCYAMYGEDSGYNYSDLSIEDKKKLQDYLEYKDKEHNRIYNHEYNYENDYHSMVFAGDR